MRTEAVESTMKIRRERGFTLIELMIVVAIIGILAVIVYPSYARQVQKSRRAQAKADITEIAQQLERQFTANRSYTGFALPFTNSPRDPGARVAYLIAADIQARAYTLTAAPTGPQTSDTCGTLTLTNTGVKTHSAGDNATCTWGNVP